MNLVIYAARSSSKYRNLFFSVFLPISIFSHQNILHFKQRLANDLMKTPYHGRCCQERAPFDCICQSTCFDCRTFDDKIR